MKSQMQIEVESLAEKLDYTCTRASDGAWLLSPNAVPELEMFRENDAQAMESLQNIKSMYERWDALPAKASA